MTNRFLLKQFAGGSEHNGVFGSFQSGSKELSSDPAEIQKLDAWDSGWCDAVSSGSRLPRLEEMQGLQYVLCKAVKELYSEGIPLWAAGETYYRHSIVSFVNEGVPSLYYNKTGAYTDADPASDTQNWKEFRTDSSLQPCQIVSGFFSADWTPEGWHACDGTEFTRAQFPEIYDNYLTSTPSKAVVCTYDAYAAEISAYGQCAKFAVDAAAQKFKIPTIKDGAAVNQALSASEAGKAYNESLPNAGGGLLHFCGSEEAAGSGMVSVVEESAGFGGGIAARKVSAFFDLKRSNSTYQDGAKVQTDHVRLRHFVVLSNGQINQSMMDWAAYMGALDGKAGADAVNFTADGKSRIINWEAPDLSNFVTNIFNAYVSSAAQTYTAPEAGWVCVLLDSTTPADSMVYLQTSNAYQDRVRGGGGVLRLFLGKGQTCALLTAGSATASAMISSFFPAKGINNV